MVPIILNGDFVKQCFVAIKPLDVDRGFELIGSNGNFSEIGRIVLKVLKSWLLAGNLVIHCSS